MPAGSGQWMGKVNFVEIRSFWHIFRSFDRMWSFLILSLQVNSHSMPCLALVFLVMAYVSYFPYPHCLLKMINIFCFCVSHRL